MGFKLGHKGYKLYDLHARVTFISRNAIFYESQFPYAMTHSPHEPTSNTDTIDKCEYNFLFEVPSPPPILEYVPTVQTDHPQCLNPTEEPEASILRRSDRVRKPPTYLKDFHCNSISSSTTDSIKYPLFAVLSYAYISPHHMHFISSITINEERKNYKQAIHHPHWVDAMNSELEALHHNGTWTITDLPPGKTPIGCKWVFKIKYKSDGSIERYKARVVAKGYTQIKGMGIF